MIAVGILVKVRPLCDGCPNTGWDVFHIVHGKAVTQCSDMSFHEASES